MIEVKKCPFCGGEAAQEAGKDLYGEFECVYCKECSACIKADTKEEAIAGWNNRKPVDDVLERLEKELNSADAEKKRCAGENPFHFDIAKGYATGIYNAIEIIKEELGGSTDV